MVESAFEASLAAVFARGEHALAERLTQEKAKADNLQAEDTSRLAFILTEAIEHELQPVVRQALAGYDAAINRPITPNDRWEEALRRRIGQAVDAGVSRALALDHAEHPWKPLLSAEAPKL